MRLYHGSNQVIDKIDLKRGRRGKDFGQGFYLSADRHQAQLMAERTVDREEVGEPVVMVYDFDETLLYKSSDGLKVKIFEGYTIEWAEFIIKNRSNGTSHQAHDYDIVYGPIADDKVGLQISRYNLKYISMKELIKQLSFLRPTFQYFFGSEKALGLLKTIDE